MGWFTPLPLPRAVPEGVGALVLDSVFAAGPGRQRELAEACAGEWEALGRPTGLVGRRCLVSTDGETVLRCGLWAGPEAYRAHAASRSGGRDGGASVCFIPYRHLVGPVVPDEVRCVVTASFDVDGAERQRYFVDSLIAALPGDAVAEGAGAAHFLLSADGSRVVLYTEWADEGAHARAAERGAHDAVHEIFSGTPGVRALGGRRYWLHSLWDRPAR
ncbi:antibiotic biosynthesis monooxygenase [Streptomyces sp. YIM 98790]|uniref:antibiotic biosynthesis monooxygenase n=1 Tax=Streptomyces sp. YIM 98790 TaxID=2689077 RepID=UPI00140A0780|nr:antibiotic biosynthesis monooxygenase [Streptomyces sp. YIM 98790]